MVLGKNIKNLRKFRSWTQEDLEKRIGVGRGNVSEYEKGKSEPRLCTLIKMAEVFGVKLDDLVNKEMFVETEVKFKEVL